MKHKSLLRVFRSDTPIKLELEYNNFINTHFLIRIVREKIFVSKTGTITLFIFYYIPESD